MSKADPGLKKTHWLATNTAFRAPLITVAAFGVTWFGAQLAGRLWVTVLGLHQRWWDVGWPILLQPMVLTGVSLLWLGLTVTMTRMGLARERSVRRRTGIALLLRLSLFAGFLFGMTMVLVDALTAWGVRVWPR
jgi:hypothetical protein